jgi:Cu-Zn family superoxide dismutase
MKATFASLLWVAATMGVAYADDLTIDIHLVSDSGIGEKIGTIHVTDTKYGALFTPSLTKLPPGLHGFHVHEHDKCDCAEKEGKMTAAHAAGSHYDPGKTGGHKGPFNDGGHLGDLPPLYVDAAGNATMPVLAPRLKVKDLDDRALMIHAGGDNFSDQPAPLGGGGARIACGVIDD